MSRVRRILLQQEQDKRRWRAGELEVPVLPAAQVQGAGTDSHDQRARLREGFQLGAHARTRSRGSLRPAEAAEIGAGREVGTGRGDAVSVWRLRGAGKIVKL